MATLDRALRRNLANTIGKARGLAEEGARAVLESLAVHRKEAYPGVSDGDRAARVKLRAHARQLGDVRSPDGSQSIDRLVTEVAYEHWHRILFARFLAENDLLVIPGRSVSVSLDEIQELALDRGRDWLDYAGECASQMLPQIFRPDDPALQVSLPREIRQQLEKLVSDLEPEVFQADDSLGWVYQFWQADKKEQVNRAGVKIGADELPAVTQLFTEDYMVLFLLENTIGAWWAGQRLKADPDLARNAVDEDELRRAVSVPGYEWQYLRFVRGDGGLWRPAAGTFPGWPRSVREIKVLDPCMGSGHFLVFALFILFALRMAEEGLDEAAALMAVLRDNLHGLEIDPRCTQIAAFALALATWKRIGGARPLPPLNLACSGLAIGMGKNEFVRLAEKVAEAEGFGGGKADLLGRTRNPMEEAALARRRGGLEGLYDLFAQAPVLGSLIDPRRTLGEFGTLFEEGFEGLAGVLGKVLARADGDPDLREAAVTAQGLAKAAELLAARFTLVATNVPYLGKGKMIPVLRDHCERHYTAGSADIANVFFLRFEQIVSSGGSVAVVSPQNWLALSSYSSFRVWLLKNQQVNLLGLLGKNAFQDMNWWAAITLLTVASNLGPGQNNYAGLNVGGWKDQEEKASHLTLLEPILVRQASQLENPEAMMGLEDYSGRARLSSVATCSQGISPGDTDFLTVRFWEIGLLRSWAPIQYPPETTSLYAGRESLIRINELPHHPSAAVRGEHLIGCRGFAFGQMNNLPVTRFEGVRFSNSTPVVVASRGDVDAALWCFFSSADFLREMKKLNDKSSIDNGYFTKIPFDLSHWQRVAAEKYPNGLPKPYSNDPTQWLFDGHPRGSADPNVLDAEGNPTRPGLAEHPLQVAVARLLGYRWPRRTGSSFMDCPAIEEPDEIERAGVVVANGIVCLSPLAGESDAATRLRDLIRVAWGADYKPSTVDDLLMAEGHGPMDLAVYLRDHFFQKHCAVFHQTPFIWQVWDGRRDGFHAFVNYHKLAGPNGEGRRTLEKLTFTYLGRWITRQEEDVKAGKDGAEARLAAAKKLKSELEKILAGEPPYDIFIRWKPLHEQPIGWEPDIDDGVRVNIRPFLTAKPFGKEATASACILRVRPRIKHGPNADRGTEPQRNREEFPWFWSWDGATADFLGGATFDGKRWNDLHYSIRVKTLARDKKRAA